MRVDTEFRAPKISSLTSDDEIGNSARPNRSFYLYTIKWILPLCKFADFIESGSNRTRASEGYIAKKRKYLMSTRVINYYSTPIARNRLLSR